MTAKNTSEHLHTTEHTGHKQHAAPMMPAASPLQTEPPQHKQQNSHTPDMSKEHRDHGAHNHHQLMIADYKKRFFISLIITVPIMLLSPMIQMFMGVDWRFWGDTVILFALSTAVFIYGGWLFIKGAKDELAAKSPGMMTLITLAICVAYIYSTLTTFFIEGSDFFWELATLVVIMLLGHWIEMRSVMGASEALDGIMRLMPENAHVIGEDETVTARRVSELKKGDHILVKPGEKIPADGTVYDGDSSVSEAMITGEATPVTKTPGDNVIGGSINGEGILKFAVTRTGEETFISQVIRLVRDAQASKSRTQRLADKAAKWLFYLAVLACLMTFITWIVIRADLGFALERAVTVIIISCPHALGLAIPLVTAMSTGIAVKHGLLIRNRASFEEARKIDTIVFDKTGTLTEGRFGVTDIKGYSLTEEELLEIVYSMEYYSEHPIARGIVDEGDRRGTALAPVANYQNITGQGLKATVGGLDILIVNPSYLRQEQLPFDESELDRLAGEGKTVIYILSGENVLGYIALMDIVRESARQAIKDLRTLDIVPYMLTGDHKLTADAVAKRLGIEYVLAEVLPHDKAAKVAQLQKEGRKVAMTGDGVNDAPALAKADIGIAVGAGTDVAIETADVILVKSNPRDVVGLMNLSRATYRKMIQNLIWATAYNIIALPLAAGILLHQGIIITPALGAVLMSLSTIIVAINARLLKIK